MRARLPGGRTSHTERAVFLSICAVFLAGTVLAQGTGAEPGSSPSPVPTQGSEASAAESAETLIEIPLDEFIALRESASDSPDPSVFDWSSDGCTSPIPSLRSWVDSVLEHFRPACERHDFGYRNLGGRSTLGVVPSEELRRWIDERLLEDMQQICSETTVEERLCLLQAEVIYRAVRAGGQLAYIGGLDSLFTTD